jgi:hypothetical protein
MKKVNGLFVMGYQVLVAAGLLFTGVSAAWAETVTNNLDVQGGFIYNHGAVNPGDIGMTFTNAGIRDITISAGQLSGVDPVTGEIITNSANLLSLKAESLTATGDIVAGGSFVGDGSGLTNLNISSSSLPTSGVWNVAGITITNATLAGHVAVSSLNVNSISGNGAGLTNVVAAAGGSDGQVQYNSNGTLAGYTNLFVHPSDGGLAVRERSGNFLRMYNGETLTDTNLIVSLRNESGTSVLRLRKNNQDNMVLKGDGSLTLQSNLTVRGNIIGNGNGLTNLNAAKMTGRILAGNLPLSGTWNASGVVLTNVQIKTTNISGNVAVMTNLTLNGVSLGHTISNLQQQVAFGNSNFLNKIAVSNELNGALTIQSNLAVLGQVIVGSTQFVQQTISNVVTGSLIAEGIIRGDGSGLTNLNISSSSLPTSGVWNAAGMTITNATLAGQVFVSSLNVDSISGNGAGLTNVAAVAGGSDGQVQYNSNGALAGYTNLFVHPSDGGLAVRERSGNFLRMYNGETLTDTNLIVSLRNESGISVLRLRKNNQDTIRLSGDGSITFGGETRTTWPSGGGDSTNVVTTTFTYVPPQGDLAMGIYTNGVH